MATQIGTSSTADATATPSAALVAVAPSDATINALYFDDGNGGPHLGTAAAPYTSWSTQAVGSATHRNAQAVLADAGDDALQLIVTSPSNGPAYFTAARSGGAWSPSFSGFAETGGFEASPTAVGVALGLVRDQQGRLWCFGLDDVLLTYQAFCDYYNGSSWTSGGAAVEGLNLGEQNKRGLAGALAGNYLVLVYDSGSGGLKYLRADVHGASIGAWSTAAAVGSVSDVSTASVLAMATVPGTTKAILVYTGSNGVSALVYDGSNDTWGAPTVLSASTNDRHPALVPGASGVVYAVWCQYAAANSYALVGEAYAAGSWAGSVSTLEAAGSNIAWPNGAYLSSGTKLGLVWTQGTSAPYGVEFDNPAAPPTSSTKSLAVAAHAAFQTRATGLGLHPRAAFETRIRLAAALRDTFKVITGLASRAAVRFVVNAVAASAPLRGSFVRAPMSATPNTTVKSVVSVSDANGNLVATCSVVSVVVTFPDGSQSSFSLGGGVTNTGSGTYTVQYNTKGEGQVLEDWSVKDASGTIEAEFHNFYAVSF